MTDIWVLAAIYFTVKCAAEFEAGHIVAGVLSFVALLFCGATWIMVTSQIQGIY